jgi:hypothetical protein
MIATRRLAALLLLAAAAACGGPSGNEQVQARFKAHCEALVPNARTVAQAVGDIGFGPNRQRAAQLDCKFTDATQGWDLPAGSTCPDATVICQRIFQVLDTTLCTGPAGGCVYACETFSPGQPSDAVVDDSVVCGAKFVTGQGIL